MRRFRQFTNHILLFRPQSTGQYCGRHCACVRSDHIHGRRGHRNSFPELLVAWFPGSCSPTRDPWYVSRVEVPFKRPNIIGHEPWNSILDSFRQGTQHCWVNTQRILGGFMPQYPGEWGNPIYKPAHSHLKILWVPLPWPRILTASSVSYDVVERCWVRLDILV